MATRSNIYLKLKPEDAGKVIKFDIAKLPEGKRATLDFPIPPVRIPKFAKYIGIYHHWDGHTTGVGQTLLDEFDTYDKVLNLLSMGDMSSINDEVISYRGWRNEKTPPTMIGKTTKLKTYDYRKGRDVKRALCDATGMLLPDKAIQEEYAYLFDGEKWLVAYYGWDDASEKHYLIGWTDLAEVLAKGE